MFPVSLSELHSHLNAPQIGKTVFNGFSYFPPPFIFAFTQNGNVGDIGQSLINLSTCLSTANLKLFSVTSIEKCCSCSLQTMEYTDLDWGYFFCGVPEENKPVQVI